MAWPRVVSGPAVEPVSVAEARDWCRYADTDEDGRFAALVPAARALCEQYTRRALCPQTLRLTLDEFPGSAWWGGASRADYGPGVIFLPRPPVWAVTDVTYIDAGGVTRTLDPGFYEVDATTEPARLVLADGASWPDTAAVTAAARVTYAAGYPATTIPAGVTAGAAVTVTPGSMVGITAGAVLAIGEATGDGAARESVTVSAVTDTTFTATFALTHAAGVRVVGCPEGVRAAVLEIVRHLWERPDAGEMKDPMSLPPAVRWLLDPYRVDVYAHARR